MATKNEKQGKPSSERPTRQRAQLQGRVQLQTLDQVPDELSLHAYLFDSRGNLLGEGPVDRQGGFLVPLDLAEATDAELIISPAADQETVRASAAISRSISTEDWETDDNRLLLTADLYVLDHIWLAWWPLNICISGHVRKVQSEEGQTEVCPVPYVKVEIFDVDREACWWPWIVAKIPELLDRPVMRIPDLIRDLPEPPEPIPWPDPVGPLVHRQLNPGQIAGFNPQPDPPTSLGSSPTTISPQPAPPGFQGEVRLNPQPEVPGLKHAQALSRVGETNAIAPAIGERLETLTLTSRLAPWVISPKCFYSKELVCQTTTDENGYFQCCFPWWPWHVRWGRLRFDARPDIIIRVTQIVDGVETVIYLDPYTSTRWNVAHAHIDLFLDDEEIRCGSGDEQDRPGGSQVFFTRIGDDEVYQIDQATGLYDTLGPSSNVAYGGGMHIYAQFGDDLSSGSPARYYRLTYAKQVTPGVTPPTSAFKPIMGPPDGLTDTRVDKNTNVSETHYLGPQKVGTQEGLFEVRDFATFLWYNPDQIGTWYSWLAEEDTGTYVLRLEVFDENGAKLNTASGLVDYRDGTVIPPAVLPAMTDHCDLVITLDNKPPVLSLQIPAVLNDCGVIPYDSVAGPPPSLPIHISVTQENGRLHAWGLYYTKGVSSARTDLAGGTASNGAPLVPPTVSGASMTSGLHSTCAFALKLWARAHVRNGRNFINYREELAAVAIERCPAGR